MTRDSMVIYTGSLDCSLNGETRRKFLRFLRNNDEIIVWWVFSILQRVAGPVTRGQETARSVHIHSETLALVEHFKRHFADEISALPV